MDNGLITGFIALSGTICSLGVIDKVAGTGDSGLASLTCVGVLMSFGVGRKLSQSAQTTKPLTAGTMRGVLATVGLTVGALVQPMRNAKHVVSTKVINNICLVGRDVDMRPFSSDAMKRQRVLSPIFAEAAG